MFIKDSVGTILEYRDTGRPFDDSERIVREDIATISLCEKTFLVELIDLLKKVNTEVPQDVAAMVDYSWSEDGLIEIYYERPYTEEDAAEAEREHEAFLRATEDIERATYERLKQKYEGNK